MYVDAGHKDPDVSLRRRRPNAPVVEDRLAVIPVLPAVRLGPHPVAKVVKERRDDVAWMGSVTGTADHAINVACHLLEATVAQRVADIDLILGTQDPLGDSGAQVRPVRRSGSRYARANHGQQRDDRDQAATHQSKELSVARPPVAFPNPHSAGA